MNGFVLINGKGEGYNLFDIKKSPAFNVDGWGYEDVTEFIRIGSTYCPLTEETAQRVIETALSFYDEADKRYRAFVDFAIQDPLTIRYTNDVGEYFIPCRLRTIAKPDKPRYKVYVCPASFVLTDNPYRIESSEYRPSESNAGKIYPYTYPYTYSDDNVNTVVVRSDSHMDSPCILTIYGQAVNPVWRHYNNGILVETGAYSGTIPEGHYLVVDAKSVPYSIIEYDSAGRIVADRYALCDFSTERFMHANEGRNRYVVSHDGVNNLQLRVEAYIQYETV